MGRHPDIPRLQRAHDMRASGASLSEIAEAFGIGIKGASELLRRAKARFAPSASAEPSGNPGELTSAVEALVSEARDVVAQLRGVRDELLEAAAPNGRRSKAHNEHDMPSELARRQVEVVARELGVDEVVARLGIGKKTVDQILAGRQLVVPPSVDAGALDRLYVIVRMTQLELEACDDEVDEVRRAIARHHRPRLIELAEGQRRGA